MNQRHFHQLLTRYRSGTCTEREARLVDQWFALIDGDARVMTDIQSEETEAQLWQAIQERTESGERISEPKKSLHFLFKWRWAAAAVLVLMAWGGYQWRMRYAGQNGNLSGKVAENLISKTNTTAAPMWVLLSDGSRVSLQPQSTIAYPPHFQNARREIILKGKAFFEVVRNEQKPFLVHTAQLTTKVLGTSFWVNNAPAGKGVEVSVVTGKVFVFQKDKEKEAASGDLTSGVILSRNQSVKFTSESTSFIATLVKRPVMEDAYRNAFVFDDARLTNVAQTLEKAYGIDIILTNDKLKNCLFTADINNQPLFTQLSLIAASVNATYSIKGTRIFLSGKGCP
ncbi:unnamed protein product [Phaeothamnion confervicola]